MLSVLVKHRFLNKLIIIHYVNIFKTSVVFRPQYIEDIISPFKLSMTEIYHILSAL